jgi:hypothetical protein
VSAGSVQQSVARLLHKPQRGGDIGAQKPPHCEERSKRDGENAPRSPRLHSRGGGTFATQWRIYLHAEDAKVKKVPQPPAKRMPPAGELAVDVKNRNLLCL